MGPVSVTSQTSTVAQVKPDAVNQKYFDESKKAVQERLDTPLPIGTRLVRANDSETKNYSRQEQLANNEQSQSSAQSVQTGAKRGNLLDISV